MRKKNICNMERPYEYLHESGYVGSSELTDTGLTENDMKIVRALAGKSQEDVTQMERLAWKLCRYAGVTTQRQSDCLLPVVKCMNCKFRDGTPGQPNILCG